MPTPRVRRHYESHIDEYVLGHRQALRPFLVKRLGSARMEELNQKREEVGELKERLLETERRWWKTYFEQANFGHDQAVRTADSNPEKGKTLAALRALVRYPVVDELQKHPAYQSRLKDAVFAEAEPTVREAEKARGAAEFSQGRIPLRFQVMLWRLSELDRPRAEGLNKRIERVAAIYAPKKPTS